MNAFFVSLFVFISSVSAGANTGLPEAFELECDFKRSRQINSEYNSVSARKVLTQNDLLSANTVRYTTSRDLSWRSDSAYNNQNVTVPFLMGQEITIPIFMTSEGLRFAIYLRAPLGATTAVGWSSSHPFEVGQEAKLVLGTQEHRVLDYMHVACKRTR